MKNTKNIKYSDIKNLLKNNKLNPISDINNSELFSALNSLNNASSSELTFYHKISEINILKKTKAKACLIDFKYSHELSYYTKPIIVNDVYKAFAVLSNLFYSNETSNGKISKHTDINKESLISKNVQIDPFVVIKENTTIDQNVLIKSNCTIGPNVSIGPNSIIHSNSIIKDSKIGANCIIKSGAVIGGAGFGFDLNSKTIINHIGNVIINDNCNIGSNTTIDKAVFDSTIIDKNTFIDNLVQIAHNVIIGEGVIIASQTGIAGSTVIGNNVIIGGQVGISGHLKIGNNVKIAAKSGVTKHLKDNSIVAGFPAIDIKKWKLNNIKLNKLK